MVGTGVFVAVYEDPEDTEEEGEHESVAEIGWSPDVAAKWMTDIESSGTAADNGGCANCICEELSRMDRDAIEDVP